LPYLLNVLGHPIHLTARLQVILWLIPPQSSLYKSFWYGAHANKWKKRFDIFIFLRKWNPGCNEASGKISVDFVIGTVFVTLTTDAFLGENFSFSLFRHVSKH